VGYTPYFLAAPYFLATPDFHTAPVGARLLLC
jgi:hypothetical protein